MIAEARARFGRVWCALAENSGAQPDFSSALAYYSSAPAKFSSAPAREAQNRGGIRGRQLFRGKSRNFKNSFNAWHASGCGSAGAWNSRWGACEFRGCFVLAWSFRWSRSLRNRISRDRLGEKSSPGAVTTSNPRNDVVDDGGSC